MNSLPDRFRTWFDYERDCNTKTLGMLESVPEDQRTSPEFQKALDRMGHIVTARRRWLSRLTGTNEVIPLFPSVTDTKALTADVKEMENRWVEYLNELDDFELERETQWTTDEGQRLHWIVEGILTHIHGHTYYHRGQIAQLVAALGGKAVDTDYLFWAKLEPID